ncbi:MAG: hypothetical protein EYC68_17870 [Chloroflexota bacterium]|nr:MAG: hypothetical protein EYC68_17870 [Chloroflexota bacterium]
MDKQTARAFVVLVDLSSASLPLADLDALFSSARDLERQWQHNRVRVLHLIAGCWNQLELKRYYDVGIQTSFPYTRADNYFVWRGLSLSEVHGLLTQKRRADANKLNAKLLLELCDRHAGAIVDTLLQLDTREFNLDQLFTALKQVARTSSSSDALVALWQALPVRNRQTLQRLVTRRHIRATAEHPDIMPLVDAGVAKLELLGDTSYITFCSWFVELVVRVRGSEIGLAELGDPIIPARYLMPSTSVLNLEAYHLIHDIENTARNVVTHALYNAAANGDAILVGQNVKHLMCNTF